MFSLEEAAESVGVCLSEEARHALRRLVERAAATHPELSAALPGLVVSALRGVRAEQVLAHLEACQAGDLLLATAAAQGDTSAQRAIEQVLGAELDRATRLSGQSAADDVRQLLLTRLLMGDDRGPALHQYSGRGPLRAWLRVAVLREVHRSRADAGLQVDLEDVAATLAGTETVEAQYLAALFRHKFRDVFREALGTLTSRQRNLLRFAYVDRLRVEQIAAMHGVHRVSASRWLSEARDQLLDEVRRLVASRLDLSTSDELSLLNLVCSRPEISLGALLP